MIFRSALFGLAALATLSAAGVAHASVIIFDLEFDLATYQPARVFKSQAASSFTAVQCATCGQFGDPALSITTSLPNGGALAIGFISNALTYNPTTQGPIDRLFAYTSKDLTTPLAGLSTNTFRPLIQQNGEIYMGVLNGASVTGPTTTGYREIFGVLSAASFQKYNFTTGVLGGGNPDFTAGAMNFGVAQFQSGLPAGATASVRFDTLYFDITSTPPAAVVPEPATWAMMIGGFGMAGAALRRRRTAVA